MVSELVLEAMPGSVACPCPTVDLPATIRDSTAEGDGLSSHVLPSRAARRVGRAGYRIRTLTCVGQGQCIAGDRDELEIGCDGHVTDDGDIHRVVRAGEIAGPASETPASVRVSCELNDVIVVVRSGIVAGNITVTHPVDRQGVFYLDEVGCDAQIPRGVACQ